MTEEQKNLYLSLYPSWSSRDSDSIYLIYPRAENCCTLDEIISRDKYALEQIQELESWIEKMKAYRAALAARYAYLSTDARIPFVSLTRRRGASWSDNKVYYDLVIGFQHTDGTKSEESRVTYSGTERSKALAAYHAYVKSHPGISATLDIAKSRWER